MLSRDQKSIRRMLLAAEGDGNGGLAKAEGLDIISSRIVARKALVLLLADMHLEKIDARD